MPRSKESRKVELDYGIVYSISTTSWVISNLMKGKDTHSHTWP